MARFVLIAFLGLAAEKSISGELEPQALSNRLTKAEPVEHLPDHVQTPEGELSFFADYNDGSRVVLYLVNRTARRIGFFAQDSDPFVKLEALDPSGEWERAQKHRSSSCGNSIMFMPSLRPGEFFRFLGYSPGDGEPRTVRYRVFHDTAFLLNDDTPADQVFFREDREAIPLNLLSNAGAGRVRAADIEEARRDTLAIPFGSFATIRDFALGTARGDFDGFFRPNAIEALGRFPTDESLALLRGFLSDSDFQTSGAAMRALAKMALKHEPAEKFYQELLGGDDAHLQASAILAMDGRPLTDETIRFAKEQLTHDDLHVRAAAMSILGRQCKRDAEMKAFINSLYDDPDPKIQSVFEIVLFPTCINYQERGRKDKSPTAPAP